MSTDVGAEMPARRPLPPPGQEMSARERAVVCVVGAALVIYVAFNLHNTLAGDQTCAAERMGSDAGKQALVGQAVVRCVQATPSPAK